MSEPGRIVQENKHGNIKRMIPTGNIVTENTKGAVKKDTGWARVVKKKLGPGRLYIKS